MAYNSRKAFEALSKKYGVTTQTAPVTQQPKKAAESQLDKLAALKKKYNVRSLEDEMHETGYLTDTPVGNALKVERTTPSSEELRKRLDNINAKITEYQEKAKESENEEWLASISHVTFNDTPGTVEQARARTQTYNNLVQHYQQQRDKVAAELDDTVYSEYMKLADEPDFAAKSLRKTTATGEKENLKGGYVSTAFTDPVYDYINGNEEAEGFIALQESRTGAKALGFDKTKYSQMTADEVAVYNYLYTQGKEKADEYLAAIDKKLSERQAQAEVESIEQNPSAVGRAFEKGFVAAQSGLNSSMYGLAQSMSDEVLPKTQLSHTGAAVRESTSGVGRFAYDTVEQIAHMLPSILTSYAVGNPLAAVATTAKGVKTAGNIGRAAASLVTALTAAGNSYAEYMEKGLTKQQSKTISALIGASEAGLQYLLSGVSAMGGTLTGVKMADKLAGISNGLARVGAKFATSALSEATEEVLQLYVEPIIVAAVTHEEYNLPEREEVIYTALLSAITANFFEAGKIASEETSLRRAGKIVLATDSVQAVIDDAAASDNPAMRRLADKLTKRLEDGKKITAYDLGRIVAESANPDALIQIPEEAAETQTETVEPPAATAEIPSAVGETMTPTQAPAQQTTPFETKTETIVGEDGATRVKLPQVIRRDAEAQTAKPVEIADPYPDVPTHSPTGRRYTDLERSGIASGASQENMAMAQRLANYTKRRILFYDGDTKTGNWARANGAYVADDDIIYINSRAADPIAQIFAHEMTHSVEGTDSYGGLRDMILDYMAKRGSDLDALREAKRRAYGITDANFDVDAELVAEFAEKNLLTNETEIHKVATTQPSLGRAILDWINGLIAKLPFAKGAKERDFLIRARDMYAKALKEAQTRSDKSGKIDSERAGAQFSISEIVGQKKAYGKGVILDTDIFNNHHPRQWGPVLRDYVYNNFAGKEIATFDENGNPDLVYFARKNDRVKKEGASREHKVIDKLARYNGDAVRALTTVHLPEALISAGENPQPLKDTRNSESDHQWMDQNGWIHRTVYLQNKRGDIFEATLNIADGRDRKILYDVTNIKKIDIKKEVTRGTVSSAQNERDSHAKSNFEDIIQSKDAHVNTKTAEIAKEIKDTGSAQFSMRTWSEQGRGALESYLNSLEESGEISKEDATDLISRLDDVYQACQEFRGSHAVFSAWSDAEVVSDENGNPVMSVIVPNGDYPLNIDFSTICKKRKTLNNVLNALVKDGTFAKTKLGGVQIANINNLLRSEGFEVACALCFVDSKRYNIDRWAESFAKKWNGLIDSLGVDVSTASYADGNVPTALNIENADWSTIDSVLAAGEGKKGKSELYKMARLIKEDPSQIRRLKKADFMSSAGLDAVKAQNPELYALLNQHGGVSKPKIAHSETQYISQIVEDSRFTPAAAYKVGGVRLQSFSDYMGAMFFDYVQMIGDLEAKKLPAHAYTKERHFVELFGMTGVKINMSLVPSGKGLDENGDYTWSNESFDFDTAVKLQSDPRYDKNVGTICVGVNDTHIRTLLADDRIRMVIPYHKSGINKTVAKTAGIEGWSDYTNDQSTRKQAESGKWIKLTSGDFDFYADLEKTKDPRKTAKNYIRWCEEKGYKPKFDKFAYETIDGVPVVESDGKKVDSNYYKLLIDFAVYDSNGNYTPQGAVKMQLPEGYQDIVRESLDQAQITDDKTTAELSGVIDKIKREILKVAPERDSVQFSIHAESSEQTEEKTSSFSSFPKKAQNAIERAERYLITGIGNLLSVPGANGVEEFQTLARKATDAYLKNGRVPDDLANELFDTAYEKGRQIDDEFYNTYKHIKDYLRKTPVVLRAEYRSDMGDYNEFRKKAFNVLNLNNAATRGIDQVYLDLIEMAPELFPEDITHPADQLQRMYDVATSIQKVERNLDEVYGPEAEGYKEWARAQFYADLNDYVGELNSAKRYADAEAAKRTKPEQTLTAEDVKALHKQLKPLKRELEKAIAKNLLTDADRLQVGRLLRGDILLKHLDPETDNVKGITEVYEAALKCEEIASRINEYKQNVKAARRAVAQELVGDTQQWKDRLTGIMYDRETPERNLRKIVKDPERAETLIKAYIAPVHEHEADATRFKKSYRDRVRNLKLSRKINKGDAVSESYAVQLLGEAEDCIAYLEQAMRHTPVNKRDKLQRGGKSLADWKAVVENLFIENPGLDEAKIRNAVEEFRAIYDELFERMNDVRVRNGYDPVSYRRGYFPHFQASDPDGLLATFGKALGITTDIVALPTTINGLTHTFKPGIRWFGNALERVGFETTYDAVQGFDKYIEGVADVIHHTDDIQNLRALASWVRYAASDEGLKEQENAIRADPNRSDEDKELAAQELYKDGKYRLSKFVTWLEEYTNLLANKKSRHDRDLEDALNRNIYNAAKNLESRVAANMVSINIGSWLTNFIPITQASAAIKTKYLLKGMVKTLAAIKNDDGMVGRSDFLTNRRGSDPLVQNWTQKTSAVLSKGMELVDSFTSDTIVRARYYENLAKGLSEEAALSDADAFAASVIADRSKGAMPTLFQRKNPITKLFTQFQLEVNNQLSYLYRDIPRETRDKGIAALAMALLKFMIGAWLYNEVYEFVIGRRPALDVLNILNETAGDVAGWEIPNLIDIGRAAAKGEKISFESERETFRGTSANLLENIFEQLPFTSLLNLAGMDIDAGRVAISSAVPNFGKVVDAFEEGVSGKKRLQTLAKELGKPAAYILPPFGGGQIKKIVEGISAVSRGGSYTVDKEGNDILQYPIYRDATIQTFQAALGAAIFGKTSLRTGREWVESGFKSLSAKDTAVYQALVELGENEEKSYNFIKELKTIEKTDDVSAADLKRKHLAEADFSDAAKCAVYYTLLATDKEIEALTPLLGDDKKMAEAVNAMLSVHTEGGNSKKMLDIATEAGVSYDVAAKLANEIAKLEPQSGKKSVTGLRKWRVAVDLAADEKEASALLKATMSDSQYERYENAVKQTKISSAMYIKGLELLSTYGSSPSNDEVTAAIQDMASNKATLPAVGKASGNLTDEQRAILWQMWTGSTSVKNNPWASKNDKALKAAEKIAAENNK